MKLEMKKLIVLIDCIENPEYGQIDVASLGNSFWANILLTKRSCPSKFSILVVFDCIFEPTFVAFSYFKRDVYLFRVYVV